MFPAETKVLVVDDLKTIRTSLRDNLTHMGFSAIHEAEDGESALRQLKDAISNDAPFGLIICDWNMPKMTGLDLLEARNADDRLAKTPFLMITIESEREYVLQAVALGVNDFIVKPFSEKTLEDKLRGIWARLQKQS